MNSKILLLSELYYPELVSTGHYVTKIAERLSSRGYDVSAICCQPNYGSFQGRAASFDIRNGVKIHRCWSLTLNKNRKLGKLLNILSMSLSLFFSAIRHVRRGDTVFTVTNPPLLPFFAAITCWFRNANLVLRIDDLYPDVLIVSGFVSKQNPVCRILDRLYQYLFEHTKNIVVLGRDMEKRVRSKCRHHSIHIVPNWADTESVRPIPSHESRLRCQLDLSNSFTVGFAGNMGPLQDFLEVMEAVKKLKDCNDVRFLFIGSGRSKAEAMQQVSQQNLKNVFFLDPLPRTEQNDFLNASDVGLVALMSGMHGIGVPSRLYNLMAAGKPIIAMVDEESEVAQVIKEEEIGWVVPPGDSSTLASTILTASNTPRQVLDGMSVRARTAAEEKYAEKIIIERYVNLIVSTSATNAAPSIVR